jgi:ADP-heptose:LPS heptosyltransferase
MPQRDIPPDAQRRLLERLLETQPYAIVTQAEVPPGLSGRVLAAPFLTQVEELCGLVRHAAGLVSTDTAMPHLADAWHVPTHTVFTTHRPHWRVRDYPHCTATHLQGHGLPEALEFIRSEADLHAVAAAWQAGIGALEAEIDRFVAGL